MPNIGNIVRIKARNSRSCAITDAGEVWHWGGYLGNEQGKCDEVIGFKQLADVVSVKEMFKRKEKILDFDMGFAHDVLLTECKI